MGGTFANVCRKRSFNANPETGYLFVFNEEWAVFLLLLLLMGFQAALMARWNRTAGRDGCDSVTRASTDLKLL